MRLPERADEDVVASVVVIVADGRAEAVQRHAQSGLRRYVRKCAIAVVAKKMGRGRAIFRVACEISPVYQQNILITVAIVINERAARAHRFRKPLFSESAVVVGETQPGLGRDVAKR